VIVGNRVSKQAKLAKALEAWFAASHRQLPWRSDPAPYRVWVSEIMLQQTQVVAVLPFFDRFIARFPTVSDLAMAPLEDVLTLWSGLGYYSRARNLWAAARTVVSSLGGVFPSDREGWEALPGVGPYTAGAILSIAYHRREAILDGNVERVAARLWRMRRSEFGESPYRAALWAKAGELVAASSDPSPLNQSLMELGALVCRPKNPNCAACPVSASCEAFASGEAESLPEKRARTKAVTIKESRVLVVDRRGQLLLAVQGEGSWRAGLCDLLTQEQWLEWKTRLGAGKTVARWHTRHVVTHHRIERATRVVQVAAIPAPKGWAKAAFGQYRRVLPERDAFPKSAPLATALERLRDGLAQRKSSS